MLCCVLFCSFNGNVSVISTIFSLIHALDALGRGGSGAWCTSWFHFTVAGRALCSFLGGFVRPLACALLGNPLAITNNTTNKRHRRRRKNVFIKIIESILKPGERGTCLAVQDSRVSRGSKICDSSKHWDRPYYLMVSDGSFHRGKVAGACILPLSST